MNRILILISFFLFFLSCDKKDKPQQFDSFIIGLTFGECIGDCDSFFKLSDQEIFADDCEFCNLPGGIIFQTEDISTADKLARFETLEENIPDELLSSEQKVFGCPDCGDWGAIHVILEQDDELVHYILDNLIDGNPDELRSFALQVRETVQFLKN